MNQHPPRQNPGITPDQPEEPDEPDERAAPETTLIGDGDLGPADLGPAAPNPRDPDADSARIRKIAR